MPRRINQVLGTDLADHDGDVEEIRHPKNELKRIAPGFDEIEHGRLIVDLLDVPHILSRPETCRSLRTLLVGAPGDRRGFTGVYRLDDGAFNEITRPQIDELA